jgi:thymidine phosphorylase
MLLLGKLAGTLAEAREKIEQAFASGAAAERFARMVAALGGPADLLENPAGHLPAAPIIRPVFPDEPGLVQSIDTRGVGQAVVALGGGRSRPQDAIDPAVGLVDLAGIGDHVGPQRPLGLVHARSEVGFEAAQARLRSAYRLGVLVSTRGLLIWREGGENG